MVFKQSSPNMKMRNNKFRCHESIASRKKYKIIVYGEQPLDYVGKPIDFIYEWYFIVKNPEGIMIYNSRDNDIIHHTVNGRLTMYAEARKWALENIR